MNILCTLKTRPTRSNTLATRTGCIAVLIILCAAVCSAQDPASTEGWVVLPVDEYRALRMAAFPAAKEPAPPPVEATLTRIDYDLTVDGELASGEARLTVDVIKDGWVSIAIPIGLMVREARLDGRPVSLVTPTAEKGGGPRYLLLSRTGRSVLTLGIVAQVSSVAGTDVLQLPISSSAITRASVVLPGKSPAKTDARGVDLHVTGGLLLEKSETTAGSRWVAHGRGNEALTFAWRRKVEDQRPPQALRLRGSVTQLIGLGEDATQVNAEVQVEVLQGVAAEVRVQLPAQLTVNQVSGAMVADWETSAQELTVKFIEPVQQTARFIVSGEVRLPRDGQIDVPLLRLATAERETGGVAVEVLGAGEIKEKHASGLEETEAAELGQLISSRQAPSLVAFRMRPADGHLQRSITLRIARYTPQAVLTANVEEAQYSVLMTQDGKMLVQARFAVRNNQRSFLKLTLPAGAVLWSASIAGRPIRPGRAPDGALLLPLEKTKTGQDAPAFAVEVAYVDHVQPWAEKGRSRLSLATLDMPISRSSLLLHHPPLFRLTPVPGSFRATPFEQPRSAVLRAAPGRVDVRTSSVPETQSNNFVVKDPVTFQPAAYATTPTRNLPIRVAFPHFGPSVFLVSELTSENQTPVVELDFQQDKKRGEK